MDEEAVREALAGEKARAKKKTRGAFGPEAMARVVRALRGGATYAQAAAAEGFSAGTVHKWRRKSPAFAAACADAAGESDRPRLVPAGSGDRAWQVRRARRHKFTRERKEAFREHFAATLDAVAAAEVAGVGVSTAYEHRRTDRAFAHAWAEAVEIGLQRIAEEAARQRLAAMERIRVRGDKMVGGAAAGAAGAAGAADAADTAAAAAEFDRTMTFLKIYGSRAAGGKVGGPALTKWDFEAAFGALEKKLEAYRARRAAASGGGGGGGDSGGGSADEGRGGDAREA